MRFVLRCALGAIAVAGVALTTACQSTSTGAPAPAQASTTTTATTATPTTLPAGSATAVNNPGFSAAPIGVVEGGGGRLIAPNEFVLSGDSTLYVEKASWKSWATTGATGSGVMVTVDCVPDCADGHQTRYPVTIRLTKPVTTSCGQVWDANAFVFTGPVPNFTPTFMHANGHAEWDLTPDLTNIRC